MNAETNIALSRNGHIAIVDLVKPPYNYLDLRLAHTLAATLEELDAEHGCRAVVLTAQGKAFCAGSDFSGRPAAAHAEGGVNPLYAEAIRILGRVREAAIGFAAELSRSAPIAVQSTRATLRRGLVEQVRLAVAHESAEQDRQRRTADHAEGVAAAAAHREARFIGA